MFVRDHYEGSLPKWCGFYNGDGASLNLERHALRPWEPGKDWLFMALPDRETTSDSPSEVGTLWLEMLSMSHPSGLSRMLEVDLPGFPFLCLPYTSE